MLERSTGSGWIAIGDAAASYDPIASRGLVAALESGIDAAASSLLLPSVSPLTMLISSSALPSTLKSEIGCTFHNGIGSTNIFMVAARVPWRGRSEDVAEAAPQLIMDAARNTSPTTTNWEMSTDTFEPTADRLLQILISMLTHQTAYSPPVTPSNNLISRARKCNFAPQHFLCYRKLESTKADPLSQGTCSRRKHSLKGPGRCLESSFHPRWQAACMLQRGASVRGGLSVAKPAFLGRSAVSNRPHQKLRSSEARIAFRGLRPLSMF